LGKARSRNCVRVVSLEVIKEHVPPIIVSRALLRVERKGATALITGKLCGALFADLGATASEMLETYGRSWCDPKAL